MDGELDPWARERELEMLPVTAIRDLKVLKDTRPDLIPYLGNIHVAEANHQLNNDGSAQLNVTVYQRGGVDHSGALEALRDMLRSGGFAEAQVTAE